MDERIDEIGFGKLRLIQKTRGFCYGIDAVILADFVKVKQGGCICDLGTGTGIIPLILSHKTEAAEIVGVELQQMSFETALRNVELNHLETRLKIVHCDVKEAAAHLEKEHFDAVVSNPPYMGKAHGIKNAGSEKTIARHETTAGLWDFMNAAKQLLKDRGDLYMVHRPSRLADLCSFGRELRLEPKDLRFVAPKMGQKPNIVLIHFAKYGNPELKFMDTLYVYNQDGSYTEEIMRIYERV